MSEPEADRKDITVASVSVTEATTEAIRYWEPRRFVYIAILAAVVILHFFMAWPSSRAVLTVDLGLTVFVLAVIANALYCLAYVPDVFVQRSSMRNAWLRWRGLVFAIGTAFAATIARFLSIGLFSGAGPH